MLDTNADDWVAYRKHVMAELSRLNVSMQLLNTKLDTFRQEDITDMRVQIAMLQVKAGVWGLVAGLIPALAVLVIQLVR